MAMEVIPEKKRRGRPYIQGTDNATVKVAFTLPNFIKRWLDSKTIPDKKGKTMRGRSKFVTNILIREKRIEDKNEN